MIICYHSLFKINFDYRSIFVHRNVVDIVSHFLFKELQKVLKGPVAVTVEIKSQLTRLNLIQSKHVKLKRGDSLANGFAKNI